MYKLKKLYKPEIFQGKNKRKNYFEGWYYKFTNEKEKYSYAVIPGISLGKDKDDSHSFIQVIDGIKGNTYVFEFGADEFKYDEKKLYITIGDNVFYKKGVKLNLKNDDFEINCNLSFKNIIEYPSTIVSPGIMGFFSYFNFMECNHGVVNLHHEISGELSINSKALNTDDLLGYIEKDWGVSFPSSWIWMQGNDFKEGSTSFMVSVANIPFLGFEFIGFLGFLYTDDKVYRFGTYNFSKIESIHINKQNISLIIKHGRDRLIINAKQAKVGILKAPKNGNMSAFIEESINADIHVKLARKGKILFEGSSVLCGMEISDRADELINKLSKGKH